MRGEYKHLNSGLLIPNHVTNEGETAFIKMIAQAAVGDVSAGGNWYFGLMEDATGEALQLTDIAGEPSAAGGYVRQAIVRDGVGFPTIGVNNGIAYAETATIAFTASGADFDTAIWRLFMCNVVNGTAGLLFAISSPLDAALLILDTETHNFNYRLWMR